MKPIDAPPPATRREAVTEVLHGIEVHDPYRWLEEQESPETREWIDSQNTYTQEILGGYAHRDRIEKRLNAMLKIDAYGMPFERNGWYFFSKRLAVKDQPIICRRRGLHGADEVLLDPELLGKDVMTSVSMLDISTDGSLLIYGIREGGADEISVHVRDLSTSKDLPDTLERGRIFSLSLKPDKSGFYYATHSDDGPRIRYHAMGTGSSEDTIVFGEGFGAEKIIGAGLTEDGRYLLMVVYYGSAAEKTEVHVQRVGRGEAPYSIVTDVDARFEGEIGGDTLFLQTDWKAPNGRVLAVDLNNPNRENWKEIVPTSSAAIEGLSLVGGKVFINYLENVNSRVSAFSPEGELNRSISFPSLGSVSGIYGRWNRSEAFFNFSSFHIPPTIYRYDSETGSQEVWAQAQIPVDTSQMEVRQVWYSSKDGTKVPMFLVHRKNLPQDGNRPVYLTGYGGFNSSLTPYFSSLAAIWAEAGGIFALPNLRGGGEFGEEWHRAGIREKKQNVFDDFYAAAEWLIENEYTNPCKIAISGGSNGGLLVGAALTQRPELFRAVVCSVPLLDMVRYHQFLVARFWVPEYGSSEDAEEFKTLYAYSPYHRVTGGGKYPAVLFMTGDSDTRVAPLHARKMCALLQTETGSDLPVMLHYDTKAGHSAGLPVTKQIQDATDQLVFLFQQLGIDLPS
jgi:prolyl oligopeptidase